MKKQGLILILAMLLLLQGCRTSNPFVNQTSHTTATEESVPTEPTTESGTSGGGSEPRPVPSYVYNSSYAKDLVGYLSTNGNPHYLLLMNKEVNQFGDATYEPASLSVLDPRITLGEKYIELESRAAMALYAMIAEMAADGIKSLRVTSGYRDCEYQAELYEDYKEKEMTRLSQEAYELFGEAYIQTKYLSQGIYALDAEDAEKVANYYSARPGQSEHQTGLCVDFMTLYMTSLDYTFEESEAFRWLSQNAYRFGFILRYPSGKSDITGYIYEPWHYRYVGREAATEIHFGNLTLEEYLQVS